MSEPSFDELLRRLSEAGVRFVVVGGLALGSWGVVRGTKDCDVVPDPAPENLNALARLAVQLGVMSSFPARCSARSARLPRSCKAVSAS